MLQSFRRINLDAEPNQTTRPGDLTSSPDRISSKNLDLSPLAFAIVVVPVVITVSLVPVPAVVMRHLLLTLTTRPVAIKELLPVISRPGPNRSFIRRPCPIAVVPCVTVVGRIPIPIHPHIARPRIHRAVSKHTWRWGLANPDPDGYLAEHHRTPCQQQGQQFLFHLLSYLSDL